MTEPTDAELIAAWKIEAEKNLNRSNDIRVGYARAVLAKWGTPPAVAGEPVGWMWQHDETGRTGFVDCWQVENGWQENNPRLRLVSRLYTTPQPTQAQAGAVPLDEARRLFDAGWKAAALFCDREDVVADGIIGFGACPQFEAAFSAAHGIKGGQHGADTRADS